MIEVVFGGLAVALAMHGLGRTAGILVGDDDAPAALVLVWGLAVYLALAGWLTAAGVFTGRVQVAIIATGAVLGPVWAMRRRHAGGGALSRAWSRDAFTTDAVVVAVTAAVLLILLAAAAGARHDQFADGDGYLLGPLARLEQTGAAGATPGAVRGGGPGGALTLTSLGWVFGDWRAAHAVDGGLGLALAIALAFHLRHRHAALPYLGLALAALATAVPGLPPDLEPRWTVIALVLGTYATWRRAAAAGPTRPRLFAAVVLTAAAAATVRHGGLAITAAALIAATPRGRRFPALAIAAAVLAPYAVIVLGSGATVAIHPVRLAAGAAAAAVVWAIFSAALRDLGDRPLDHMLIALAAALAVTAAAAPSWPAAGTFAAPFVLAGALLWLIAAVRAFAALPPRVTPAALIAVVAIVMLFSAVRVKLGAPTPLQWGDRIADRIAAIRELDASDHFADTSERAAYAAAFAGIPAGARVGLWVDRGDLVDYRGHAIVDLRVPRRVRAPSAAAIDYLVIAPSAALPPGAPVARLAATGRVLDGTGDLTVLDLRRQ